MPAEDVNFEVGLSRTETMKKPTNKLEKTQKIIVAKDYTDGIQIPRDFHTPPVMNFTQIENRLHTVHS
jgi:hypothetical protein